MLGSSCAYLVHYYCLAYDDMLETPRVCWNSISFDEMPKWKDVGKSGRMEAPDILRLLDLDVHSHRYILLGGKTNGREYSYGYI